VADTIETVLGSVPADSLGCILPHEHVASVYGSWANWGGVRTEEPNPQWEQAVLDHYTPLLTALARDFGCRTIVDATPKWGCSGPRDIEVWAELSRRSGVNIVVSTGYFSRPVRPANFPDLTVSQLADEMIGDIEEGIHGTHVRAGMIKFNVSDFDPDGVKLLKAVAIAQRKTGVPVNNCASAHRMVLDTLVGAGVSPERIYLGHGDTNGSIPGLMDTLRRGCNTIFTIWSIQNPSLIGWRQPVLPKFHSAELTAALLAEGYGDQVLISMDYSAMTGFDEEGRLKADLYEVPGRTYLYMFTHVLDMLRRFGVGEEAIEHLLRDNPRRMLLRG